MLVVVLSFGCRWNSFQRRKKVGKTNGARQISIRAPRAQKSICVAESQTMTNLAVGLGSVQALIIYWCNGFGLQLRNSCVSRNPATCSRCKQAKRAEQAFSQNIDINHPLRREFLHKNRCCRCREMETSLSSDKEDEEDGNKTSFIRNVPDVVELLFGNILRLLRAFAAGLARSDNAKKFYFCLQLCRTCRHAIRDQKQVDLRRLFLLERCKIIQRYNMTRINRAIASKSNELLSWTDKLAVKNRQAEDAKEKRTEETKWEKRFKGKTINQNAENVLTRAGQCWKWEIKAKPSGVCGTRSGEP